MTLQQQARALGDPTRHRIFRFLADSEGPVDVGELTEYLGLNHNAIRQHLAKLAEAGLVLQTTAPSDGPGRPRLLFEVDPASDGRWGVEGPYQRLSLLLAEMVRSGDNAVDVGRRAGRQLRIREPQAGRDVVTELHDAIARGGFDPKLRRQGDRVDLILRTCPFVDTAMLDPDTICSLHLGLAEGLADQLGGLAVDELQRRDPRSAGCRLRLHIESGTEPEPHSFQKDDQE